MHETHSWMIIPWEYLGYVNLVSEQPLGPMLAGIMGQSWLPSIENRETLGDTSHKRELWILWLLPNDQHIFS